MSRPMTDQSFDSLVVGGGVAGLSAALVLGRARRRTLVVDAGSQSNRAAHHVGGLLGHDGTPPERLYELGRKQVGAYDSVEFRDGLVTTARADGDGFVATLDGDEEISARTLILATGMSYEIPDVPGFAELWGDAVFHCPFCHGWDVRDRAVAVYAEGEIAEKLATLLTGWTDDVTVVDPEEVTATRIEGGELRGLVRRDGTEVPCDAVLLHAALSRRDGLAEQLGLELTDHGFIQVDGEMRTSRPGVYAAGDLAIAPQQVAVALGSGHTAGLVATRELLIGR